ncbi:hypothetical protein [Streptomyces sp. NPDC059575]|uniref:hypothetical protein n=1 Tax=Streptomyces sp. NPDC059575 TaxID=3346872 RepID=UPI003699972D
MFKDSSALIFSFGVVSFIAGVVFFMAQGRYTAMPIFAVSAVTFAGAWAYERVRRGSSTQAEPQS